MKGPLGVAPLGDAHRCGHLRERPSAGREGLERAFQHVGGGPEEGCVFRSN
jgi:hypothetical protein